MHISQSAQTLQADRLLLCNFCDKQFETRKSLMAHKKKEHIEKVALCWNFFSGVCEFGDDFCWFSHSKNTNQTEMKVKMLAGMAQKNVALDILIMIQAINKI